MTTSLFRQALVAGVLMIAAAAATWYLTPRLMLVDRIGKLDLENAVPTAFGEWKLDPNTGAVIALPEREKLIAQLYSQVLSRTYVNARGERMMLSIAYGRDQRDGMQLHYPEVCYPAQGFQLTDNTLDTLTVGTATIPVRRLDTVLGGRRFEPVTYWTMVGTEAVTGGIDKKLAEMRYGLKGDIPDGLLFRVSQISRDKSASFARQDQFIGAILAAMQPAAARRLSGI